MAECRVSPGGWQPILDEQDQLFLRYMHDGRIVQLRRQVANPS
jgi:hypothetical protein